MTLLAAIIVLGLVIFVHELGHFLAAKAVGVGVPRFSIGFGRPTPLRFQLGGTEYVLSWIPLGGYVKLATREDAGGASAIEGGGGSDFPEHRLFERKPLWARLLVLSAGVAMNVALAWGIYTAIAATGTRFEDPITQLAAVDTVALPVEARPLAEVPFGTTIVRINGDTVASWNDVRRAVIDPGSDRLRFDFADGVDPVIVRIPGLHAEARAALALGMHNTRPARVARVEPGSPAARAGIQAGDEVVRIDQDTVRFWDEMVALVRPRPENTLAVTVVRGGTPQTVTLTTEAADDFDPLTGERVRIGRVGIYVEEQFRQVEFTLGGALLEGARQTAGGVRLVVVTVKGLMLGQVSPKELGGPIFIGQLSGQAARQGIIPFLTFVAFISINLAVFNLLPIPVLDGGHLLFLILEGVLGRPVSTALRLRLTQVGMAMLLALVVLVIYNDVLRVLGLQ